MKRVSAATMLAMLALVGLLSVIPARAAETDAEDEGYSAYSVSRLKIFEGSAWVRFPDSGEWEEVTTNTPIPERARINIPEGSEAELQFHGGQFVLLTSGTEVDVRRFDAQRTVFRLRSGEIRFDLPPDDFSPVRVTVPGEGKADFPVPGRYWLFVRDGGETRMVVREGESVVSAARGESRVKAGEEAMIGQDVRISQYKGQGADQYSPPPPLSNEEKEAGVPPVAAYELRDYGEWVSSPDYGYVWRPRVAVGWSPYFYGRWDWISPFGWTWISYEPWGWYPYHFGWWASDPLFGWIWCPYRSFVSVGVVFGGGRFTHFHGHGFFFPSNARFIRDGANVRWVPLRPGERFVRPAFTRADTRLVRWDRSLARGAVQVRTAGPQGQRVWRDWTAVRNDRGMNDRDRNLRLRVPTTESGVRRAAPPRQLAPRSRGGSDIGRPTRGTPEGNVRGGGSRSPRQDIAPEQRRYDRPSGPDYREAPRQERLERGSPPSPRMRMAPESRIERRPDRWDRPRQERTSRPQTSVRGPAYGRGEVPRARYNAPAQGSPRVGARDGSPRNNAPVRSYRASPERAPSPDRGFSREGGGRR